MKDTKFIFVTGGVSSSLGKGILCSSLGALMESHGFKVGFQKMDPYLNVDAGTMSPYQHGEVFVTEDGTETDLDFGHYERFTHTLMGKKNSVTAGQIYYTTIQKERKGEFLGETVQIIPHITDEIKNRIHELVELEPVDILIIEIGGTVGDIESIPFLEAIRQFKLEKQPHQVLFIHLTIIPIVGANGEMKTKPTQHSVRELRELGIIPDIIMCRTKKLLTDEMKSKIALFCNIKKEHVLEALDFEHVIYEIPLSYQNMKLDQTIINAFNLTNHPSKKIPDFSFWTNLVEKVKHPNQTLTIGILGKYTSLDDTYKSIYEALTHASIEHQVSLNFIKIEEECNLEQVHQCHGFVIPGGFGKRATEKIIETITLIRELDRPLFGICFGFQLMIIEYARNVLNLQQANSLEFDSQTPHPVITLLKEQNTIDYLGGTMRLGSSPITLEKESKIAQVYQTHQIFERHRHRYEFNNQYLDQFSHRDMKIVAKYDEKHVVEGIEIQNLKWAIGVQYHPELRSKIFAPHPLFVSFIGAAINVKM